MSAPPSNIGEQLHADATRLYPLCRSITGNGVRQTLQIVQQQIPLSVHEIPSGTTVFDWEVPLEWNIDDAYVADTDGRRVIDFRLHNLHIVSYSEPLSLRLPLNELRAHLHVHASNPEWIPYRTSYYSRNWGFCLRRRDLDTLRDKTYDVRVDSRLQKGSLTYGEFVLPGKSRDEVLLFTHTCHPSLANDNTSGIAIATRLAAWLSETSRRFSYRIVFAPGTIGSLCWLNNNESRLHRIRYGLVLGLLGDAGSLTYKQSRRGNSEIDAIAEYVICNLEPGNKVIPFEPYGYDERQLCSPGFNLPVGRLTRSHNDAYPEYHSSADDLSLLKPDSLARSLEACQRIVEVIEGNRRYVNLSPKGEPRLGKRGLYGTVGGQSPAAREHAMLWVLNQSDGARSLLDIAQRSNLGFQTVRDAATALERSGLLQDGSAKTSAVKSAAEDRKSRPAKKDRKRNSPTSERRRTAAAKSTRGK
jgi:aminopeptidase-like protein